MLSECFRFPGAPYLPTHGLRAVWRGVSRCRRCRHAPGIDAHKGRTLGGEDAPEFGQMQPNSTMTRVPLHTVAYDPASLCNATAQQSALSQLENECRDIIAVMLEELRHLHAVAAERRCFGHTHQLQVGADPVPRADPPTHSQHDVSLFSASEPESGSEMTGSSSITDSISIGLDASSLKHPQDPKLGPSLQALRSQHCVCGDIDAPMRPTRGAAPHTCGPVRLEPRPPNTMRAPRAHHRSQVAVPDRGIVLLCYSTQLCVVPCSVCAP